MRRSNSNLSVLVASSLGRSLDAPSEHPRMSSIKTFVHRTQAGFPQQKNSVPSTAKTAARVYGHHSQTARVFQCWPAAPPNRRPARAPHSVQCHRRSCRLSRP